MFTKISLIVLICLNVSVLWSAAAPQEQVFKDVQEIPKDIPICSENEENLNECILNSFRTMLPRIRYGLPELNIPPMDPFELERRTFQFSNKLIQGKASLRNLKIVGLSDTDIKSVEFNKDGNKVSFTMESYTPKLKIDGQFKAEVNVNNGKFNSKGTFDITMIGIKAKISTDSEIYEKDGHSYLRFVKLDIDPTLKDMQIKATGLMPDPTLNQAVLEFANQNWRTIYKSLIAETRSTWEPEFLQRSNEFFSHLPFDLLLPKN